MINSLSLHQKFSLCSSGSSSSDNITVPGTNSSSTNTELISDNLTRNPTVQAQQPNNGSQQLWPNANEGSSNSFSTVIHTGMDFFHQTAAAAASSDVVQPQLPHQPFQVQVNLCQKLFFFASINPQYEARLFIELQVQYMKIPSFEHGENMLCTEIVFDIQNNFFTQHVLPMFCKKKSF